MARFVLVHGAWQGGWCWDRVAGLLRDRGHEVLAPDLLGHGEDPLPAADQTMEGYIARVREVLDAGAGPAVLVGHSMGGISISAAASAAPGKVAKLVYLCAYLPLDGDGVMTLEKLVPDRTDRSRLEFAEDGTAAPPLDDLPRFFGTADSAEVARIAPRLSRQARRPFVTPVALGPALDGIERHYIECTEDRAIPPALQRAMAARAPGVVLHALPTDHSPFLSDPDGLAALLDRIAA